MVWFTCLTRGFNSKDYSYYAWSLESCCELLSHLVRKGWQLQRVHYGEMNEDYMTWIELPVDAFDGDSMEEPLLVLQQEWEQVLG